MAARFLGHIVRDDAEMDRIRLDIKNNPANWQTDDLRTSSEHSRVRGQLS